MPSWTGKSQKPSEKAKGQLSVPEASSRGQAAEYYEQHSQPNQAKEFRDDHQYVQDYYEANSDSIRPTQRNIAHPEADAKSIDDQLNNFTETSKTLIKGLTALSQLHPFIAIAVGAFALVVTMDITRRENDRKVLAVKVQMRDLMAVFFELRHIRNSEEQGPDGVSVAGRLEGLMKTIAKDVKECGSVCDVYLKKGFLAKTVKAGKYELRLAEYAELFVERRKSLELGLSLHTSIGVDVANQKLDGHSDRLRDIEEKLDMILLFRKLDTPREKEVQKFIDENGGPKACITNDQLLEELIAKSGETLSKFSGRETGRRSNELPDIKKKLLKEMQEDIDDAFSRNMVLFERKLDIQSKQLAETVQQESDYIVSSILAGAHDRITDPDLRNIWKEMGWKGSVKATRFVLALHDYYSDQLSSDTPQSSTFVQLPSPQTPGNGRVSMIAPRKRQDDKWALTYVNAAYVQPIQEAVDDDGTGFISVKEVNTFVEERPDGWSLPHWFAYWAVGWQASMTRYQEHIYKLVSKMFKTLEFVLPSNRRAVDEYLFHSSFWRIELLLRSARRVSPKVLGDTDLMRLVESYEKAEEQRLDQNLRDVAYELDTPASVSLITGQGRIERYIFPLIYLLLRQHLKVFTIACNHVIDTEELVACNESLVSILLAVEQRVHNLEAIFKQTHVDIQARLGNFAFGVFQLSYGDVRRIPIQNSLGTWMNGEDGVIRPKFEDMTHESVKALAATLPHDILKYGIQDGYHSSDYFEFEPQRLAKVSNPIQGTWSGHCLKKEGDELIPHILRLSMRVTPDHRNVIGKGEDYSSAFDFIGEITIFEHDFLEFTFTVTDEKEGLTRTFTGTLDESDFITAKWSMLRRNDSEDESANLSFVLRRIHPSLLRYLYTQDEFVEDPVRSRWAFVCGATLHMAQEKLWSRRFFETRFNERKRFVELTTRSLIVSMGLTPQTPLNSVENGELEFLRRNLNPSEARFYQALAEFEIQKLPWHPAWGCDWCERRLTKWRILCIHCMSEDLSDNIDLCASCIDKTPAKRSFNHETYHSLVKVEQTLHDYEFSRIVISARETVERIKALFRTIETMSVRPEDERSPAERSKSDLRCACCLKNIAPPCWVCVVCTRDTFICIECDSKRQPSIIEGHTFAHALVRIRDASITGEAATTEEKLMALEQRLVALEFKVAEGFSSIESKVEEQLVELENKMERRLATLEANVEARFSSMENVLRQIAAQTAALPAVYGQVVRDYAKSNTVRNY